MSSLANRRERGSVARAYDIGGATAFGSCGSPSLGERRAGANATWQVAPVAGFRPLSRLPCRERSAAGSFLSLRDARSGHLHDTAHHSRMRVIRRVRPCIPPQVGGLVVAPTPANVSQRRPNSGHPGATSPLAGVLHRSPSSSGPPRGAVASPPQPWHPGRALARRPSDAQLLLFAVRQELVCATVDQRVRHDVRAVCPSLLHALLEAGVFARFALFLGQLRHRFSSHLHLCRLVASRGHRPHLPTALASRGTDTARLRRSQLQSSSGCRSCSSPSFINVFRLSVISSGT